VFISVHLDDGKAPFGRFLSTHLFSRLFFWWFSRLPLLPPLCGNINNSSTTGAKNLPPGAKCSWHLGLSVIMFPSVFRQAQGVLAMCSKPPVFALCLDCSID
jgi:hypothetical protein